MSEENPTAESLNTEEKTIPYERFREVNEKAKKAEKRLSELEDLYKEAQPKAAKTEELESVLSDYLEQELKKVVENKKKLIPKSFSAKEKLDYLRENRDFFFEENFSKKIGETINPVGSDVRFSREQIAKMTPSEYKKNQEKIRRALAYGLID